MPNLYERAEKNGSNIAKIEYYILGCTRQCGHATSLLQYSIVIKRLYNGVFVLLNFKLKMTSQSNSFYWTMSYCWTVRAFSKIMFTLEYSNNR